MAFVVRGKSGKVVGTYATRGEAERRIAQLKAGAERLRPFQFAGGRHQGSPSRGPKMEPGYALMLAPDGEHEDVMVSSKADRAKWVGYKRVDGQNMAVWEIDGQLYAQTAVGPRAQHSWRGQPRRHAKAARLGHRRAQRSPAYLTATTRDANGNEINLSGESVEELAKALAEYGDPTLSAKVYDEPGFVRGWIHGDGSWKAQ